MKTITTRLPKTNTKYWNEKNLEKILFFDIETTGLSADTSYLYLICCGYYQDDSFILTQWFSEDIQDEPLLLDAFFSHMKNYTLLVHYNGTTFDINYLLKKCRSYKKPYHFDNITSLDMYKRITPYKSRFQLKNYKQKTLESFLGIKRKDRFDGGELISVYTQYIGRAGYEKYQASSPYNVTSHSGLPKIPEQSADELRSILLLHNAEDVSGLMQITTLLPLFELFEGKVPAINSASRIDDYNDAYGETLLLFPPQALSINFNIQCPVSLHYQTPYYSFFLEENLCTMKIPLCQRTLKYFFSDYQNYYYLPSEDKAVHKSVAEFVDKSHRKKATAATAYTKKQGDFLPQSGGAFSPELFEEYNARISYFEFKEEHLFDTEFLRTYISHLLTSSALQ